MDEGGTSGEPSSAQGRNLAGSLIAHIASIRLERAGGVSIAFVDGRRVRSRLGRDVFDSTSSIASSTYVPHQRLLHLRTTRDDEIAIELPVPRNLAPVGSRPTIYLDQNHWSTLTKAIYEPHRVRNAEERIAAERLIEYARSRQVLLPVSSAHISETCKQLDADERYRRALTIVRLSSGWQLRDPLELRRFELRQALMSRYHQRSLVPPAPVTLEPNAVHSGRDQELAPVDAALPEDAKWAVHAIRCIGGIIDAMLDAEHVPVEPAVGWAAEFQRFAVFLRDNPTGREMRRRRTHAKFVADLGRELPEEAYRAGISPEQMSDWVHHHSELDVAAMPALGLFREILHEKLVDPNLRWVENDLIDMIYLTAAAGYCDYVVGERSHTAHLENAVRRLGREPRMHRTLRSLLGGLAV